MLADAIFTKWKQIEIWCRIFLCTVPSQEKKKKKTFSPTGNSIVQNYDSERNNLHRGRQ